ncbi:hypothetical protein MTR_3g029630 [Medicago truncatula]|uniref:Uncharacterized protein n=1 Tax=Medicago truncatula TaxID=3880 RepID=G7IZG9_MEDTR|nr:hypothetical protein MTR_3g029630 [Medicago truncatula]
MVETEEEEERVVSEIVEGLEEFPDFDSNTKLAEVYYNGGEPPHLFRIRNDVTLSGLKDQLDQINRQLNYRDTRRVVGVEYRCPLSDSAGSLRLNRMKLTNDDDMITTFSVFGQHNTKGLIELDASLVRYVEQILKSLIRPRNYKEIRALLEGPEEEVSLDYL